MREALVELRIIGAFRRLPHPLVEPVGVVADQNAPAFGLDAIEDDPCGLGGRHGRFLKEAAGAFEADLLNVFIRHLCGVDSHAGQALARRNNIVLAQALAAIVDLARIRNDRCADMAGHHHRTFDMRRVEPEIVDQRLGKSLYREFGGAVGGVRRAEPDRGPEPVDARGIDDMALVGLEQHRQEGADPQVNPAPANVEGPFPLLARAGEQAAAAADPGVVEQQMDPVGRLLLGDFIAEALELVLDRDVGDVSGDAQPLRQPFDLAKPFCLRHRLSRNIAHRDIAALGDQLARELAPHAGAAPGDDRDLSGKILHGIADLSKIVRRLPSITMQTKEPI